MLKFVQGWFAPPANPIGVDFGTDCLRLAQCEQVNGEWRLVAAASADVPSHLRQDPAGRLNFFADSLRDLLAQGNFRGRRAVLALPAASMHIQHLRMAKMDDAELKKAMEWEARGKLPMDPTQALMRHIVAGDVYQDQEPKIEVILMAAGREMVNQLLNHAARAKLDIIGMNVEPKAVIDCFSHVYRRKTDTEVTNCFVDIGASGTRVVVTRATSIMFARTIPIGGEHFARAVASGMKISLDDARLLRTKLAQSQPAADESREKREIRAAAPRPAPGLAPVNGMESRSVENSFVIPGLNDRRAEPAPGQVAGVATEPASATQQQDSNLALAEQACEEPVARLIADLDLCRRYHESVFPNRPIDRLIFVGGEARQRGLCQRIARDLSLAAQIGDPMVRMARVSDIGVESGIDRRLPQPSWAVAIGLSMGPRTDGASGSAVTSSAPAVAEAAR